MGSCQNMVEINELKSVQNKDAITKKCVSRNMPNLLFSDYFQTILKNVIKNMRKGDCMPICPK